MSHFEFNVNLSENLKEIPEYFANCKNIFLPICDQDVNFNNEGKHFKQRRLNAFDGLDP